MWIEESDHLYKECCLCWWWALERERESGTSPPKKKCKGFPLFFERWRGELHDSNHKCEVEVSKQVDGCWGAAHPSSSSKAKASVVEEAEPRTTKFVMEGVEPRAAMLVVEGATRKCRRWRASTRATMLTWKMREGVGPLLQTREQAPRNNDGDEGRRAPHDNNER